MKIGITGTHGSGKSDYLLELAQRLKRQHPESDVGVVQEVAKRCPLPVNGEMTLASQLWITGRQITTEIEREKNYGLVICDRIIIDPWIYGMVYGVEGVAGALREVVQAWLPTYDRIILIDARNHNHLTADGFRETDPRRRLEVYNLLSFWLETYRAEGLVKNLEVV